MGKSNKFDYTNRPNSGSKLGHIIGRDLEKEADKVIKDAEKQAAKARKVSIGSAASTNTSADAREHTIHTLDIKVPGKELGNEGACAMASGLGAALRKGTDEAAVVFEDLDLSGNGITTVSLERLAPAIALASRDLKNLNLANNDVKVETDDEAAQWETFLCAFKDCSNLRRLDLANNENLGARAIEILAKIHIQEAPIQPKPTSDEISVRHLIEEELDDDQPTPKAASFGELSTHKRRKGLQSLPFLVLNHTGMNDAGALWLSYVIEDHYYPSQLLDDINISDAEALGAAQQGGHYVGLQWEGGDHRVLKDGLYLLKKTELIRQQTLLAGANDAIHPGAVVDSEKDEAEGSVRRSLDRRHSRAKRGDRRASIRSSHTTDGHEVSELESVRKKIQRSIIEKHGAASVELWRSGMRMATAARVLHGIGPSDRDITRFYIGPPMFDFNPAKAEGRRDSVRPVTPSNDRPKKKDQRRQGTYAATLTANTNATAGEPELVITEVTNSPTTPKMIFKPHRKGAFSDGGDVQLVQKLDALIVRDQDPRRFVKVQEARIEEAEEKFRNSKIPSHLPASMIEKIAGFTVSERERRLMSTKQRDSIVAWGEDRKKVVELEREWRKMADSAQVWMLLESIDCLEYQRE